MIFTIAVIGATMAVAALPNALAVLTGDIEKHSTAAEANFSPTGSRYQLEKDLKKLRAATRWSVLPLLAQFLIVLILLSLAIGPAHILEFANLLFRKLARWNALYPSAVIAIKPFVDASKEPFDRGLAWVCAAVALVLLYWRGWRPFHKGRRTAREGINILKKLKAR
jgi:hypothetical protein